MESGAVCPYCKQTLKKRPGRKAKCPFCIQFIYVRTLPSTRERVLVTASEAEDIEREWARRTERTGIDWFGVLEQFGVSRREVEHRRQMLGAQEGNESKERTIIWGIFNELVTKTQDLQTLSQIYYQMATFLDQEGRDHSAVGQQSRRMELLNLRNSGVVTKVSVLTAGEDSCETCRRFHNKTFTLQEALEQMPIPCKGCTHTLFNPSRGFCRCVYLPEID